MVYRGIVTAQDDNAPETLARQARFSVNSDKVGTGLPRPHHESNQPLSLRSKISPTSAGFALPLLSFITCPLSALSTATLPAL